MKFYNAPKLSLVRVIGNVQVPPGEKPIEAGEELFYHYTDGVYTVCTNKNNVNVFPAVWTEIEIIDKWDISAPSLYKV